MRLMTPFLKSRETMKPHQTQGRAGLQWLAIFFGILFQSEDELTACKAVSGLCPAQVYAGLVLVQFPRSGNLNLLNHLLRASWAVGYGLP